MNIEYVTDTSSWKKWQCDYRLGLILIMPPDDVGREVNRLRAKYDPPAKDEKGPNNCAQTLKHLPDLTSPLTEFARVVKPSGTITFSVTHPEMNWEDYEMFCRSSFNLAAESDIHHHRFWQYFEAIERVGLRLSAFRQVPVCDKIRKYLTSESYQKVRGRYQIALFQAIRRKSGEPAAIAAKRGSG